MRAVASQVDRMVRIPSSERGCEGKANLGRHYVRQADRLAAKHGKRYGVYRCPHCGGTHMTTKLENAGRYAPLLHVTANGHASPDGVSGEKEVTMTDKQVKETASAANSGTCECAGSQQLTGRDRWEAVGKPEIICHDDGEGGGCYYIGPDSEPSVCEVCGADKPDEDTEVCPACGLPTWWVPKCPKCGKPCTWTYGEIHPIEYENIIANNGVTGVTPEGRSVQ